MLQYTFDWSFVNGVSWRIYCGFIIKTKVKNFDSLKNRSDIMLQLEALLMSACSFLVSTVDLIICRHLVSLAKIKGLQY